METTLQSHGDRSTDQPPMYKQSIFALLTASEHMIKRSSIHVFVGNVIRKMRSFAHSTTVTHGYWAGVTFRNESVMCNVLIFGPIDVDSR